MVGEMPQDSARAEADDRGERRAPGSPHHRGQDTEGCSGCHDPGADRERYRPARRDRVENPLRDHCHDRRVTVGA